MKNKKLYRQEGIYDINSVLNYGSYTDVTFVGFVSENMVMLMDKNGYTMNVSKRLFEKNATVKTR